MAGAIARQPAMTLKGLQAKARVGLFPANLEQARAADIDNAMVASILRDLLAA